MNGAFVDWLSFTVPKIATSRYEISQSVEQSIENVIPEFFSWIDATEWQWTHGRRPYSEAVGQGGILCHHNQSLDNILVEISGAGCQQFTGDEMLAMLALIQDRVTRIDIARDHLGNLSPLKIAKNIPSGRFKARSTVISETGETAYIGSRKSDQYTRIYRYFEPHPRANITRVEYVARKAKAKKVVQVLLSHGIEQVYSSIVNTFKLPNSLGNGAEIADLRLERLDRSASKTHIWLLRAAVPAIKKLVKSGEIANLDQWVDQYLRK